MAIKWIKVWHNHRPPGFLGPDDLDSLAESWPQSFTPVVVISGASRDMDAMDVKTILVWRRAVLSDPHWSDRLPFDVQALLDIVWRMTNSVDDHWSNPHPASEMTNSVDDHWSNPHPTSEMHRHFKMKFPKRGGFDPRGHQSRMRLRSSMIGDIFETSDERLFVVMVCGFREIPHPAMVAKIPREELPLHLQKSPIFDRMIAERLKQK